MQTVSTEFERILTSLMDEALNEYRNRLSSGMVMSFEDYKYECGRIAGFLLVKGYFDEVNATIANR